jgi:hypothetical protein
MSKVSLRCVSYRKACLGSHLKGYADIEFSDLKMIVRGIAIHAYENGRVHAQPPAQAILKNGVPIRDQRGRVVYSRPLLSFANEAVREAWVQRVVAEVLRFDPDALDCRPGGAT